jgi:hypothetical protein
MLESDIFLRSWMVKERKNEAVYDLRSQIFTFLEMKIMEVLQLINDCSVRDPAFLVNLTDDLKEARGYKASISHLMSRPSRPNFASGKINLSVPTHTISRHCVTKIRMITVILLIN